MAGAVKTSRIGEFFGFVASLFFNKILAAPRVNVLACALSLSQILTFVKSAAAVVVLMPSFVSGFWYAHALALVGEKGYDRFHRQDIVGWSFTGGKSNYQLIGPPGWANDTATLTPHPDYFTAIL